MVRGNRVLRADAPLALVGGLLAVALSVRLAVAWFLPPPADFAYRSEPGWIAINLVEGRGYTFDFYGTRPENPLRAFAPPLHPWLLAVSLLAPDPPRALGVLQAALGALTVWLVYRLAVGLVGGRAAVMVGWGAALYPAHVLCTSQPISAVLHACCLAAVLLTSWELSRQPTLRRGIVVGVLVGLMALNRPHILAFIPFLWLWFRYGVGLDGNILVRPLAGLAAAAAVVVLPWAVYNGQVVGRPLPVPSNGGVTFWNGNNPFTTGSGHDVFADRLAEYLGTTRDVQLPDVYEHPEPYPFPAEVTSRLGTLSELELDRAFYQAGLDYIRQQPADWLRLEVRKLQSFWLFRPNLGSNPLYRSGWTPLYRVQYLLLLGLALAGLALTARHWRRYGLLLGLYGLYTAIHLVFNVLTRYRWEIELTLLILAAPAVDAGWRWAGGRLRPVWRRWAGAGS